MAIGYLNREHEWTWLQSNGFGEISFRQTHCFKSYTVFAYIYIYVRTLFMYEFTETLMYLNTCISRYAFDRQMHTLKTFCKNCSSFWFHTTDCSKFNGLSLQHVQHPNVAMCLLLLLKADKSRNCMPYGWISDMMMILWNAHICGVSLPCLD